LSRYEGFEVDFGGDGCGVNSVEPVYEVNSVESGVDTSVESGVDDEG
jgi:hypothetical protein